MIRPLILLYLLALTPVCVAQTDSTRAVSNSSAKAARILESGKGMERVLAGGDTHTYLLDVSEGRWWIEAYQAGADCELALEEIHSSSASISTKTDHSDLSRIVASVSSPFESHGPEILAFEALESTAYRLTVRPKHRTAAPGHYRLSLYRASEATGQSKHELSWRARMELTQGGEAHAGAKGPEQLQGLQEARRHYATAAELWSRQGKDEAHIAATHCVGLLDFKLDAYAGAESALDQAIVGWRRLRRTHLLAEAISYRGLMHQDTGDLDQADKLFREALRLYRQLGDPYGQALSENNLCLSMHRRGQLEDARRCYPDLLPPLRAQGIPEPIAGVLNSLGGAHYQLGEPTQAKSFYAEALEIYRAANLLEGEAGVLNNRAALNRYLGDWQGALDDYDRALDIQRLIGDQAGEARALNNIGYTYLSLGDPGRALKELSSALEIRRRLEDVRGQAVTLTNLGTVYENLGNPAKALTFRQRALEIRRRMGRPAAVARTLTHIAEDLRMLGRHSESLEALEEGLTLSAASGDRRFEALSLAERGQTLMALGRWDEAKRDLSRALSLQLTISDRQSEVSTRVALADLELRRNRLDAAQTQTRATLKLLDELRIGVDSPDLRAAFLAATRRAFELDIEIHMAKHRLEPLAGHDLHALTTSERARARTLLDLLASSPLESSADASKPTDLSRQQQTERLRFLASQRNQAVDRAFGPERLAQIDAAMADIPSESRPSQKGLAPRSNGPSHPLSAEEIVELLDDKTMLMEIALGQETSFLWWIDSKGAESHELPPATQLEATALKAYEELSTVDLGVIAPSATGSNGAALQRLSRRLFGPVRKALEGIETGSRLIVVADGALHYIPFAALSLPGSRGPLIRSFEVVQLPSASTLGWLRSRSQSSRSTGPSTDTDSVQTVAAPLGKRETRAVVFADPSFGPDLNPLPATRTEAQIIAALLPNDRVSIALGSEARKSRVFELSTSRGASGNPRHRLDILHFATHGVFDTEQPQRSGLMLAQLDATSRPIDGFLSLADIYDLDLPAGLVVLSGCQTALGRRVHGEGLMGLSRGFLQAGAENVIAGLWRVEDGATSRLMGHFYRGLLHDGLSPSAALRQAQLHLLSDARHRDPYFWAAFVLLGEGR